MDYFDYDRIPDYDLSRSYYDIVEIKEKISQSVVLQSCLTPLRDCFTLYQAKSDWIKSGSITCPACNATSKNPADLRKSIREQVAQQFHPSVESVQIIEGILTHKYNRKRRFTDLIFNTQALKKRFQQSNSISSIIQKQYTNQQKVVFYAYCLLDKVKIVLPVRINHCDHPGCYELTSLLTFRDQQEKSLEEDKKKIFECCHPGCSNTLNISTFQNLIEGIVLDVDLLNVLNKSPPCQLKFTYLPEKKLFDQEQQQDPIIKILYNSLLSKEEKYQLDLEGFIKQVQTYLVFMMQGDNQPYQDKMLKQGMFKTKQINLIDPLTKQIIELPVRCTNCTRFDQCMDVRSFIANHILSKIKRQITNKCILCGSEYNCQSVLDSRIVNIDYNIISQMFRDMTYQQTGILNYDGKQQMLNHFLSRQKLPRYKYLEDLEKQGNGTVGQFPNLRCVSDPQKELQIPLIIQNCWINSMIDFDTFYTKMVEIDFQIKEKPLTFCQCKYCFHNPIRSYTKSIFYHEAFGEALKALKQLKVKVPSFEYDFKKKAVVMEQKIGQRGLINEESWQYPQIGNPMVGPMELLLNEMNNNVNAQLKSYGFKIQNIAVKLSK